VGLVAAGAVAASCNLVIGTGNYKVGDAGACPSGSCACGGFAFAPSACASCAGEKCCDEGTACRADPACAALYDCTAACADAHCRNQCAAQHAVGGNAAAQALEVCLSKSDACGNACSTCGGLGEWYADTCGACIQKTCCEGAKACADDDVCAERQRCYRACTYPSCPLACDAQIAAAAAMPPTSDVIAELDTCLSSGCAKQCDHGAHWACVGAFSWPAAKDEMVTFTLHATSFITGGDLKDVSVKVCSRIDYPCAMPLQTVPTDAHGIAPIQVHSGFDGYFDVTDTADDVMETLVYLSWPITAPTTYDLPLAPYDTYKTLVTGGGGQVFDDKGAIWVDTKDCLGADAPGVSLSIEPAGLSDPFYLLSGSPVDGLMATTDDAVGGFANVDTTQVKIHAGLADTMQQIALFPVQVRAKALTKVALTPTP
jgi:hypothetical protein